jgi:hypothetical protein
MLVAERAAAQPPVPPPTIRMSARMSGEPVLDRVDDIMASWETGFSNV